MKKLLFSLLSCALLTNSAFGGSKFMAEPEKAVEISKEAAKKKPLSLDDNPGASASTGSYAGTAMSMIGWGLAIMAVVTLVVIFVKSEDATSPTP